MALMPPGSCRVEDCCCPVGIVVGEVDLVEITWVGEAASNFCFGGECNGTELGGSWASDGTEGEVIAAMVSWEAIVADWKGGFLVIETPDTDING
jgi:hypothetical protein